MNITNASLCTSVSDGEKAFGITAGVASTFADRTLGLIAGRKLSQCDIFILPACSAVHTCFMRFSIDLMFLDSSGCVLKTVQSLPPWRFSMKARSTMVVEAKAGFIEKFAVQIGDYIQCSEF